MAKKITYVMDGPFKVSKTEAMKRKKLAVMTSDERHAYVAKCDAKVADKKLLAAKNRKMKKVLEGKASWTKASKFSTADGSNYDRIKVWNSLVRNRGVD